MDDDVLVFDPSVNVQKMEVSRKLSLDYPKAFSVAGDTRCHWKNKQKMWR